MQTQILYSVFWLRSCERTIWNSQWYTWIIFRKYYWIWYFGNMYPCHTALRSSCRFSFRSNRTFFLNFFSKAAARSLKIMKYSQKQPHIYLNTKISFRVGYFFDIFSKAAARSLRNMKYSQKRPQISLNIKNMFRSSCTNFSRFLHKINTLCEKIFITLD